MAPKIFTSSNQNTQIIKKNRFPVWRTIFFGVRTRILIWYVALMAFSTLVSVLAIREILVVRLEQEIEKYLTQEVEEFRRLTQGKNPSTAQPFGDDVAAIFDVFLSRNIPHENAFLITLLNEKLYKSSPQVLPIALKPNSALIEHWLKLKQPKQGKEFISNHTIYYVAEPILKGKTQGVFVVIYSISSAHQQVNRAVVVVIQVTIAVLAIASVLAWIVAGRLLAPLSLLIETAHLITESDLSRRIPVQGVDQIAELSITFNQMLDRLETAFASQRNFINDASHELRTPITIIRGHLELLGDDPQERRETVELVTDELDRMSRFVDDLLLLAKAEQPNFLNLQTVDISLLIGELYTKATALAQRDWRLENKGVGLIVADRQRLTQAIMNLAQNATQYTSDGDVIALGSEVLNGYAYFWVRDTGVGIAPTDQERIFERFARGSHSYRRSEGAGLGLSIVRAIATAHGGRVELKSKLGEGSTFTLIIPLDPPFGDSV
ncbi:sensor histidine kinase [Brasilonema octagenarum]|uniref:sensor histidine kinase n=1 Tax=Brasilonema octagenarum TaxID=417105 RepID=UPI002006E8C2|nr:ATP-binding protein [Brasilonema octagenarum]